MTTLSNRLQAFFASDLRRAGPLWMVAEAAGAALGAALGDPV
ncbi:MAG TPA: hypothetical protein VFS21_34930 [Roseiflexaceae bacterium]|nr:hypothetical protein [Roseiflexaceae bacterium]